MKYILIWWIINPHHYQNVHTVRGFASQTECAERGALLRASTAEPFYYHCSLE